MGSQRLSSLPPPPQPPISVGGSPVYPPPHPPPARSLSSWVGWGGLGTVWEGVQRLNFLPLPPHPSPLADFLFTPPPLLRPFRQLTVAPTAYIYMYILLSWVGWVGFDVEGGWEGGQRLNFLPPPHPSPLADFLFTSPHPSHDPSDSSLSHLLHIYTVVMGGLDWV